MMKILMLLALSGAVSHADDMYNRTKYYGMSESQSCDVWFQNNSDAYDWTIEVNGYWISSGATAVKKAGTWTVGDTLQDNGGGEFTSLYGGPIGEPYYQMAMTIQVQNDVLKSFTWVLKDSDGRELSVNTCNDLKIRQD